KLSAILYRVEQVTWVWRVKDGSRVNQRLQLTRLVDDKTYYAWRAIFAEQLSAGYGLIGERAGGLTIHMVHPGTPIYQPAEDAIGQETTVHATIMAPAAERRAWFASMLATISDRWYLLDPHRLYMLDDRSR